MKISIITLKFEFSWKIEGDSSLRVHWKMKTGYIVHVSWSAKRWLARTGAGITWSYSNYLELLSQSESWCHPFICKWDFIHKSYERVCTRPRFDSKASVTGVDLGGGCRGCAPPPPEMKLSSYCLPHRSVTSFLRGAPPPKKNPVSAPGSTLNFADRLEQFKTTIGPLCGDYYS